MQKIEVELADADHERWVELTPEKQATATELFIGEINNCWHKLKAEQRGAEYVKASGVKVE